MLGVKRIAACPKLPPSALLWSCDQPWFSRIIRRHSIPANQPGIGYEWLVLFYLGISTALHRRTEGKITLLRDLCRLGGWKPLLRGYQYNQAIPHLVGLAFG